MCTHSHFTNSKSFLSKTLTKFDTKHLNNCALWACSITNNNCCIACQIDDVSFHCKSAAESHGNHLCYLHTFTVEDEFRILRPKPPTFIDSKGIWQGTVLLKRYLIFLSFHWQNQFKNLMKAGLNME